MTKTEFRLAREALGLSVNQLGHIMSVPGARVAKWEFIPGPGEGPETKGPPRMAVRIMKWLTDGFRPPEWPEPGTA